MLITFEDRASDMPLVERVWRSRSERSGTFVSMASSNLGIVVSRLAGITTLTVRGPETRATQADCPADGEWMGISFCLGAFLPSLPAVQLRDRNDMTLPAASGRTFLLHGKAWEYPGFDNAEVFVRRLLSSGLLASDPYVRDVLAGERWRVSVRTQQRRVLRATGLTQGSIRQIERARHATALLRDGQAIADVAHEAGYYDQAHLTRALGHFVGQTPAEVTRGETQLSLLYKTAGD